METLKHPSNRRGKTRLLRGMKKRPGRPGVALERVMGIEPTYEAWEAAVLPLNYTRSEEDSTCNGGPIGRAPWATGVNDTVRMNVSTILCLAAVLALAGCSRHDDAAAPAPAAAASDNSAFLEGATAAASAASEPVPPPPLPAPHADRGPPPDVPPIVRDGIRYAQGDAERDPGLTQASGMLVVSDDFSGKRLWTLAVYNAGVDAKKNPTARSIFFKAMAFDPDGFLRVVNEDDEAFLVDVRRHLATPAPAKPDPAASAAIVR